MEENDGEFKAEPTQIEIAKLENALLQAEYRFGKDVSKLQDALIRARKMGVLHLVGIHLKLVFLTEFSMTIPMERALNKWKCLSVANFASRNKKLRAMVRSVYLTNITRAFYIMKERRLRSTVVEKAVEGPIFAHGVMSPLSSDDDDLEI